jgi:hypothetical protein
VPRSGFELESREPVGAPEQMTGKRGAALIEGREQETSAQGNEQLPRVGVTMGPHVRLGFHGDGEALNGRFERRMQIVVTAVPRAGAGRVSERVQEFRH